MTKEQYIKFKMKKLVGEEGYDKDQAYAISLSYWNDKDKKQQGGYAYQKTGNTNLNTSDINNIRNMTGIEFTPQFIDSYFSKDINISSQPVNNPPVDFSNIPIRDITSDGLFTDRKVWYTDRAENFLEKAPAVEGKDYKRIPYNQWKTYQSSPEYQTYMGSMQQGGEKNYAQQGVWNPTPYATTYPSMFNNFTSSPYISKPQAVTESDFTGSPFSSSSFTEDPRTTTQQLGSGYQFSDEPVTGTYTPPIQPKYNDITRKNLVNLYSGVDLEGALAYAGQGFGTGNAWQAGLGTGLSVLKGARNFLTGYSSGKESQRVQNEMYNNLYDPRINYTYLQEGGQVNKITNADLLTNQYIVDQGAGNVNLEGGERVKRNDTGNVQLVVGESHIKNGKMNDGVDAFLQNGDKVLSDYTKIPPKNVKELKERYNLSLKKNATFADAQKAYDKKIGIQKITDELAGYIEKMGENSQTKDPVAKRLNDDMLSKKIEATQLKLNTLKEPQGLVFEDLFSIQESIPKKGNPGELLDKNGNVIEETKTVAQEGGQLEAIAGKYGISLERAQELLAYQQGGTIPAEAEQQIAQEDQVTQFVAQSLQQGVDPQEILQQLIQNGIPEEAATQILQGVMQQLQQPEQAQEEMVAQQGGEKNYAQEGELVYDVNTGRNTYRTSPRVFQSPTEGKAYGVSDPEIALQNLYNNFPDIVASEFKNNIVIDDLGNIEFKKNLPLNKEQEIVRNFQKKADSRMRASANTIINNPTNFSTQQVEEAKRYLSDETFLDKASDAEDAALKIRGFDSKLGNFTSGRYSMGLNLLTPEDLSEAQKSGIKTFKQLKNSPLYSKLSDESKRRTAKLDTLIGDTDADYTLSEVKVPETTTSTQTAPNVETRTLTENVIPYLPQDLRLAPSALSPLAKEQIALGRLSPVKGTTEPYLASAESQRQTDVARVQASSLSPMQQESILAQALASSQLASNDAIAKTEAMNIQSQQQADQFNIGQRAKEDITNAQFNQQYEQNMLKGIANLESAWRRYYTESNLDNANKFRYIDSMNLINAENANYQAVPGEGVYYINTQNATVPLSDYPTQEELSKLSPQQYNNYMIRRTNQLNNRYGNFVKAKNKTS